MKLKFPKIFQTMRTKTSKTHKQQQPQSLRIEDAAPPKASNAPTTEDVNKCDNEVRELQRASKVNALEYILWVHSVQFDGAYRKSTAAIVAS